MPATLSQNHLDESFRQVTEVLVDALGVDDDEVTPDASLVDDLGAEEIDFLDIVFRMEKSFGIRIPRGDIFDMDFSAESTERAKRRTVKELADYVIARRIKSGELVVETEMMRFFTGADGRIHVAMSLEDGTWGYADGRRMLPSHLVFVAKGRWSEILRELEDLINDPKVTEHALQRFLERHPELVKGDEYDLVVPQAALMPVEFDTEWYLDFVARPVDSSAFSKIIELKRPQIPLVKGTRFKQNPFSSQLYEAIQQLRRYARAATSPDVRTDFRRQYGVDLYRPDLHLIAGRSWDIALADRFRDFMRDEGVHVENWDGALARMRRKFT